MKKKKMLFISLFVNIAVIAVTHIISIAYYKNYGQYHEGAKRVCKIPDGYTYIENLEEDTGGILRYKAYFPMISFIDSDNMGIYSTMLSNSEVVVMYKDEYYVENCAYEEWLGIAKIIAEQRNRIYNFGEAVILRGSEIIPYVIVVQSLETEIEGDYATSTIRFDLSPSCLSESKREKIFDHVETEKGETIDKFVLIGEGTAQVMHHADDNIKMIVLKSPDYKDSTCIRKISAINAKDE